MFNLSFSFIFIFFSPSFVFPSWVNGRSHFAFEEFVNINSGSFYWSEGKRNAFFITCSNLSKVRPAKKELQEIKKMAARDEEQKPTREMNKKKCI